MERSYRELLLDVIATLDDTYQTLMQLGMAQVIYEDRRSGNLPFEDGDLIPVYLDVLEASDISVVRKIAAVVRLIPETRFFLCNINRITEEDLAQLYEDETDEPEPAAIAEAEIPLSQEKTMDDYQCDVYLCLSSLILSLNATAYWMKYEEEAPEVLMSTFYFPEEETYELFSSDDTNIQILISLSKKLQPYFNSIYGDD